VDYFYFLERDTPAGLVRQCEAAVDRAYTTFYLKTGIDRKAEKAMLEAIRASIGPDRKIRIDCNEAWSIYEAIRISNDWDRRFHIDFYEAPVVHDLPESMLEVRAVAFLAPSPPTKRWGERSHDLQPLRRCAMFQRVLGRQSSALHDTQPRVKPICGTDSLFRIASEEIELLRNASLCSILIALVVIDAATPVLAQSEAWPVKNIQIVVGFPVGGIFDTATRALAAKVQKALGTNMITVPVPGAGGAIAMQKVARAAPDGYTLMLVPSGASSASLPISPRGFAWSHPGICPWRSHRSLRTPSRRPFRTRT